jgi:hypothetical protein
LDKRLLLKKFLLQISLAALDVLRTSITYVHLKNTVGPAVFVAFRMTTPVSPTVDTLEAQKLEPPSQNSYQVL